MERKTGARGLRTILENVLLDTMYDLPSIRKTCRKVVVDEASSVVRASRTWFTMPKSSAWLPSKTRVRLAADSHH